MIPLCFFFNKLQYLFISYNNGKVWINKKLEDLVDALNQALIVKERESNDKLQEARKALVDVCFFKYFFLLILQINL